MDNYDIARELIKCGGVVALTGAGISTESGIPDFRGTNGIYNNYEGISPMEMLSLRYFYMYRRAFYDFYYKNFNLNGYKANDGHKFLANLEREGMLNSVVTQNVDMLYVDGGSKNVLHTHGVYNSGHCPRCGMKFSLDEMIEMGDVPTCPKDGYLIKVDVTLYGEALPEDYFKAYSEVSNCDTLLIIGTSLGTKDTVDLVSNFGGKNIIIINDKEIENLPYIGGVNVIFLQGKIGEVIKKLNMDEYFIYEEKTYCK